jgi:biopolymer transport protein ExbD
VTIKDSGDIFVDKQRVALKDLSRFLTTRIDTDDNTGLFIFADKDVSVQLLLNVMDQIRISGTSRISLQTVREKRP